MSFLRHLLVLVGCVSVGFMDAAPLGDSAGLYTVKGPRMSSAMKDKRVQRLKEKYGLIENGSTQLVVRISRPRSARPLTPNEEKEKQRVKELYGLTEITTQQVIYAEQTTGATRRGVIGSAIRRRLKEMPQN